MKRIAAALLALLVVTGAGIAQAADWKTDRKAFSIGVVDGHGQDRAGSWEGVRQAFEKKLGIPTEIFIATDMTKLVDAQANDRVDYAIYSASAFVAARRFCDCVDALVAPRSVDGAVGFRSVLIGRKPASATLETALAGRYAVGPVDSLSGRIIPEAALQSSGQDLTQPASNKIEAPDDSAAVRLFIEGEVDAVFGWEPALPDGTALATGTVGTLRASGIDEEDIAVVWRSETVPHGPHAVSRSLPDEARTELRAYLLSLRETDIDSFEQLEPVMGGGFAAVETSDYDGLATLLAGPVEPARED